MKHLQTHLLQPRNLQSFTNPGRCLDFLTSTAFLERSTVEGRMKAERRDPSVSSRFLISVCNLFPPWYRGEGEESHLLSDPGPQSAVHLTSSGSIAGQLLTSTELPSPTPAPPLLQPLSYSSSLAESASAR